MKQNRNPDYVQLNTYVSKTQMGMLDGLVRKSKKSKADLVREALSLLIGQYTMVDDDKSKGC